MQFLDAARVKKEKEIANRGHKSIVEKKTQNLNRICVHGAVGIDPKKKKGMKSI